MTIRPHQHAEWRRSTFCPASNCVEVAFLPDGRVGVRNSATPTGAVLVFTPTEWSAFLGGVLAGEFAG